MVFIIYNHQSYIVSNINNQLKMLVSSRWSYMWQIPSIFEFSHRDAEGINIELSHKMLSHQLIFPIILAVAECYSKNYFVITKSFIKKKTVNVLNINCINKWTSFEWILNYYNPWELFCGQFEKPYRIVYGHIVEGVKIPVWKASREAGESIFIYGYYLEALSFQFL